MKTNGGVRDPSVTGFSEAIANEINTLRTNPGEYIIRLTARYNSFIDDYLYQLTEDSCVKTREGKQGIRNLYDDTHGYTMTIILYLYDIRIDVYKWLPFKYIMDDLPGIYLK
jgi:hypothetical protein